MDIQLSSTQTGLQGLYHSVRKLITVANGKKILTSIIKKFVYIDTPLPDSSFTSESGTTIQIDRIFKYITIKNDTEKQGDLTHFTIYASVNAENPNDYLKTPYQCLADENGSFVCQGKICSNCPYVDIPIGSLGLDPTLLGKEITLYFTINFFNDNELKLSEVIPFKANIRFFQYLYHLIPAPKFEDFKCLPILKYYMFNGGSWTPEKTAFFKDAVAQIYNKEMSESKDLQQYMDESQADVAEAFRIYKMRSLDDRVTVILIEAVIKALQLNNVMEIEKEIQGLAEKIWFDTK